MSCRYLRSDGTPCRCGELAVEEGVVVGHYDCVGPPGDVGAGATGVEEERDGKIFRLYEERAELLDRLRAIEQEMRSLGEEPVT